MEEYEKYTGRYYDYNDPPNRQFEHTGIKVIGWFTSTDEPKRLHFQSIEDLIKFVHIDCTPGQYMFRGQAKPFVIKPSLLRIPSEEGKAKAEARLQAAADYLVNHRRLELLNLVPEIGLAYNSRGRMAAGTYFGALAQHYGIPTLYTDWTTSIEVAAFFATHGLPDDQEVGYIYSYGGPGYIDQLRELTWTFLETPSLALIEMPSVPRVRNQCGLFHIQRADWIMPTLICPIEKGTVHLTFNHYQPYTDDTICEEYIYPPQDPIDKLMAEAFIATESSV